MSEFFTRSYRQSDWPTVQRIHDRARPIELKDACDARAFVPLAEDEADLREFQACDKLVACHQNKIVGFIGVDGDNIGWLYVDPDQARQGIGRYLLRQALARINCPATVHVLEGNLPALNLYKSEGFRITSQFADKNNGYPCTVLKLSNRAA